MSAIVDLPLLQEVADELVVHCVDLLGGLLLRDVERRKDVVEVVVKGEAERLREEGDVFVTSIPSLSM